MSAESLFSPIEDSVSGLQVRRIRLQLRAVHTTFKGRIEEDVSARRAQIPPLAQELGDRVGKLDKRLLVVEECLETFKVTHDQLHAPSPHKMECQDKIIDLEEKLALVT